MDLELLAWILSSKHGFGAPGVDSELQTWVWSSWRHVGVMEIKQKCGSVGPKQRFRASWRYGNQAKVWECWPKTGFRAKPVGWIISLPVLFQGLNIYSTSV